MKRFALETATLIVAAVLCALVANALASRERKLVLVGYYPNAQKVPVEATSQTATSPAPTAPSATSTSDTTYRTNTTYTPPAPQPTTAPQPSVTPSVGEGPGRKGGAPPTPPDPSLTLGATTKPDTSRFKPHPDKPYVEIGYADVAAMHNSGVLFLDARRTSVYEQGHIAGARPFSVWESDIDDKVRKLFDERPDPAQQAQPIVCYCSGGECEDSHMLAQKLWGIQFNNVYVYKDGYPDWVAHKGATHTGTQP